METKIYNTIRSIFKKAASYIIKMHDTKFSKSV